MPVFLLLLLSAALFVVNALGVVAIPLWICLLPLAPIVFGLLVSAIIGLIALIVGLVASRKVAA